MIVIDIIIIGIITFLAIFSFKKGIIIGIFMLLGLTVGFTVAMHVYDKFFKLHALQIATLIITFLAIFTALVILGKIFHNLFKKADLGIIDKIGGFCFGIFKGFLLICLILVVLITYYPQTHNLLGKSMFIPSILKAVDMISSKIPKKIRNEFKSNYKKFKKLQSQREP